MILCFEFQVLLVPYRYQTEPFRLIPVSPTVFLFITSILRGILFVCLLLFLSIISVILLVLACHLKTKTVLCLPLGSVYLLFPFLAWVDQTSDQKWWEGTMFSLPQSKVGLPVVNLSFLQTFFPQCGCFPWCLVHWDILLWVGNGYCQIFLHLFIWLGDITSLACQCNGYQNWLSNVQQALPNSDESV